MTDNIKTSNNTPIVTRDADEIRSNEGKEEQGNFVEFNAQSFFDTLNDKERSDLLKVVDKYKAMALNKFEEENGL